PIYGNSTIFAVGVISNDGAQIGIAGPVQPNFDGQTATIDDVLVKYTYFGDANLSGGITSTDYFLIDNGFLNGRSGWINGDFDYSGAITSTDYFLIDNAFLSQSGTLAPAGALGVAAVPRRAWLAVLA